MHPTAVSWMDGDDEVFLIPEDFDPEHPGDAPETSMPDAERHLSVLRRLETDRAAKVTHAEAEIVRAQRWLAGETARIDRAIKWRHHILRWFLAASGQKTVRLINGTLSRRAGRQRVVVTDADAFLAWARTAAPHLIRITEEPDKISIAAAIKADGVLPEHVEVEHGEESFNVKLTEAVPNG